MRAQEIRKEALSKLEGNWIPMIGMCLLTAIAIAALNWLSILLVPLLIPGLCVFSLNLVRGAKPEITNLVSTYKNYLNALVAYVLYGVIIAVGYFLFIIPGIIFTYMLSQVFYIIADNPQIGAIDILKKSTQMMKGYKWKLFCLHLSFIGWILLIVITIGIAFIWVGPYIKTANTIFYENLKSLTDKNTIEVDPLEVK